MTITQGGVRIAVPLELSAHDGPDGWKVVEVAGEIDLSTADRVEAQFRELINDGHYQLVADLTQVAFMDSTGLAVLLRILKRVREDDGDLVIACSGGPVRRVLAVSGVDREISVRDDVPHLDQP